MAETQEAATGLTIHTQTFLDVFRDIANEHEWCGEAEDVLRNRLGLEFKPYEDDYCCTEHSGDQRFHLAEGQPTELDAAKVAVLIGQAVASGELRTPDALRLAGLLPDELAKTAYRATTYKVTFTFTRERAFSPSSPERGKRREAADALWSGRDISDVWIERVN